MPQAIRESGKSRTTCKYGTRKPLTGQIHKAIDRHFERGVLVRSGEELANEVIRLMDDFIEKYKAAADAIRVAIRARIVHLQGTGRLQEELVGDNRSYKFA